MKDMYSFHLDQADFDRYYEIAKKAYIRVFERLGLVAKVTEASGGAFTEKLSYEFEVLTDAGEANILYCDSCEFCVNVDDINTYHEDDDCPKCTKAKLKPAKAAEVGNVFDLGQKYSKAFDIKVNLPSGEVVYPIMGCYGIGISRTMGVIVEKFHDDKGIVWPKKVAPFAVHLVDLQQTEKAKDIYEQLTKAGIEVLLDDREATAGEKFAGADLIGCPIRIVVSQKTLEQNGVEWKLRESKENEIVALDKLVEKICTYMAS